MDTRSTFGWLLLALLAVVVWLLVKPFLGWLLATGVLAFALFPAQRRLATRIGARPSAALLTVVVVVVVVAPLVLAVYAVVTQGPDLLVAVSEADVLASVQETIARQTGVEVPVQAYVRRSAEEVAAYVSDRPSALLGEGFHAAFGFLLLTFVLYYLLADGREFLAWLERMSPLASDVQAELSRSTEEMLWAVLKGHVLVAAVQGLVAGVSLVVVGMPHALLLTAAMMALALVPLVGVAPVLGGAIVYLVLQGQPLAAAFVLVWGLTSVALTDDYLRAMLIDRQSDMHSAFIFVGILGGTYLLGAIGLFVGPILIGVFKTSVEVFADAYGVTAQNG